MFGLKAKYDAEGNRITKGDVKYHWDHRNRLVKVETPSETIEYTYDYQNRLVKRSAGKNTTHFIHDGWQIVRQCENGKPVKRFLWGTKQDELLCDNDNWTLGDHLNTIREVVDASGKTLAHCDYNAFGKCLSPLKDLSFAYTGKLTDSATNLQWNINRWYDSSVGRWISEDPIGFEAGDGNLYRYVGNVVIDSVDVDGHNVICPGENWTLAGYISTGQVIIGYATGDLTAWCKKSYKIGIRTYSVNNCDLFQRNIYAVPTANLDLYAWVLGVGLGATTYATVGSASAKDSNGLGGSSWDVLTLSLTAYFVGGAVSTGGPGCRVSTGGGVTACGVGFSVSTTWARTTVTGSAYVTRHEILNVPDSKYLADRVAAGHKVSVKDNILANPVTDGEIIDTPPPLMGSP